MNLGTIIKVGGGGGTSIHSKNSYFESNVLVLKIITCTCAIPKINGLHSDLENLTYL